MHSRVSLLLVAVLLGAALPSVGAPPSRSLAGARAPEGWPPLPPGTRTLLLLTGADLGHWEPRKCFAHRGGMLYREGLNEWLFDHEPGVEWYWISTGNVLSRTFVNPAVRPPRRIYEELARIGYEAVGIGWRDLQLMDPFTLRALTLDLPLHLVATNLRVLETGAPFLEEATVIPASRHRVGVLCLLPYHEEAAWVSSEYGTVVIAPPEEFLAPALRRLAPDVDRVILLAHLPRLGLRRLLESLPPDLRNRVDLVAMPGGTQGKPAPETIAGRSALILGGYGKVLARVALDDGGRFLELRVIPVEGGFPIDPATGRPSTDGR